MADAASALLARAREIAGDLVEMRRDLHRHPELGFQEERTAGIAAEAVKALGYRVRTGVARTGVVAELGDDGGPTVALRADMDALPIQEATGAAYASTVPGIMHACGHDAHTAGLVGAARLLAEMHTAGSLPPGRVRLLFQPSEEMSDPDGRSGARHMVDEGAMDGVDAVVGLHVGAHLPAGRVVLDEGPVFAGSDEVRAIVGGRSSHAARPHTGIDAIVLAAQAVTAAQQVVSRRLAPWDRGVLTFGTIHGGTALNVIADEVHIAGTLRYFEPEVRARIRDGVRAAFATAEAMGGRAEVSFQDGYPPTVNDPVVAARVHRAVEAVVGTGALLRTPPTLGAEDFGILAGEAPGTIFWLGAALEEPREHHHPRFDIDEGVLPLGAALLTRSAVELLREPPPARTPRSERSARVP